MRLNRLDFAVLRMLPSAVRQWLLRKAVGSGLVVSASPEPVQIARTREGLFITLDQDLPVHVSSSIGDLLASREQHLSLDSNMRLAFVGLDTDLHDYPATMDVILLLLCQFRETRTLELLRDGLPTIFAVVLGDMPTYAALQFLPNCRCWHLSLWAARRPERWPDGARFVQCSTA